jgi:GAF domain-containing protein
MGLAAQSDEAAAVYSDVTNHPSYDPSVDGRAGLTPRNMLLRPLSAERHLLGMLQLINRKQQPDFTREDVNLVNYVAQQLSEFVRNARLNQDKRR